MLIKTEPTVMLTLEANEIGEAVKAAWSKAFAELKIESI